MGKQTRTIELRTDLGINYTRCQQIVLMFANESGINAVAELEQKSISTPKNKKRGAIKR